jgi:hypothetical protein
MEPAPRNNPEGYPAEHQNLPPTESNNYNPDYAQVQGEIIPSYPSMSQQYNQGYSNIPNNTYSSQPYNPDPYNSHINGGSYVIPVGQPVIGQQPFGVPPRRIIIVQQGNYGFDDRSQLGTIENEILHYKGTILAWIASLAIMCLIGFILSIWGEAYASNRDNWTIDYTETNLTTTLVVLGILIGVTFLEGLSMAFGYRAVKQENITQLSIFLTFCLIWILFDVILLIVSFGGFFFFLLIPFFATLYIIVRGKRLRTLFMEKQVSIAQMASQPANFN